MALVLVICRLCNPSSELRIAECLYERTALEDLLGLPAVKVNDDRLYRSLDHLIEHKEALEIHLKERLGELFDLSYDLLLYDVTSTFIEGIGADNEQMKRGYSRDNRPDCKQVCIALVVSRCGMPLGYEVFDGNRLDVTTVEDIVNLMEKRYGNADRIWVMDRGMMSAKNIDFLKQNGRRYILGSSRATLKKFEQELLKDGWHTIRTGLEVKTCPSDDGEETYILCRSQDRQAKEEAMHAKFEKRIEEALVQMVTSCQKMKIKSSVLERRIGALLTKNSRARRLFHVEVKTREDGGSDVVWKKIEANREWSQLSEGCYLLRTNIKDWQAEELWKAYVQLTEAETAFRIHKSDLQLRPIWHQKKERVQAHILVCFLAYVVWKTIGQLCKRAGLGDETRQVFDEIAQIKMVDVVLNTTKGQSIRRRCIAEPTKLQKVLLDHLKLRLPKQLKLQQM
jgi:transposase